MALAASRGSRVAREAYDGGAWPAKGPEGVRDEGVEVGRGVLRRSMVVFSRVATWMGEGRWERERGGVEVV